MREKRIQKKMEALKPNTGVILSEPSVSLSVCCWQTMGTADSKPHFILCFTLIFLVCGKRRNMCHGTRLEVRGPLVAVHSLLLPFGSWGSDSCHQAC